MEERTNNSLLNQYSLFYSIKESMLFKGNKIAYFTQLRKRSMLFKGKFYFDKETDKKAIGSVGHIRTLLNQRSMLFKGNNIAFFYLIKAKVHAIQR